MPPGGVRFTQTHKVTRVYYSGREDDDDAPKKHREEIFAHVLANNNIYKMTQGVTETIKNGTKNQAIKGKCANKNAKQKKIVV